MKEIILDFERLKNPNTGLYNFCKDLGKEILIENKDLDVILYLPKNESKLFGNQNFIYSKTIDKIIRPNKGNIWHLTNQFSKFGGDNNVLTIHDLNFLIEKKGNSKKIKHYLNKVQKNIDRSHKIICISKFVENHVKENLNLGGKEIEVIYNGCSLVEFPDFNEPNYKPKSEFLFSIGTFLRKKNFEVLIDLIINNNYELIIGGVFADKVYVNELYNLAKIKGVLDRVHLINSVSEKDKYWYYKNCKAFLFTSVAEGFGLPVIEAMRMGKPVFLSNLNSLPEVGGNFAYYFENFDSEYMIDFFEKSIKEIERDNKALEIIEHSNKFSWKNAAKKYLEIYKSI